uniref:Uncharacterized protein n=1 Tax=Gasterosteus aculeatus TaxID=69293 RepID=G3Q7L7_GASAC
MPPLHLKTPPGRIHADMQEAPAGPVVAPPATRSNPGAAKQTEAGGPTTEIETSRLIRITTPPRLLPSSIVGTAQTRASLPGEERLSPRGPSRDPDSFVFTQESKPAAD